MEEVIIAILQAFFEFVLEALAYTSFDWPTGSRKGPEPDSIIGWCILWFAGGCVLAWLSVLIVKQTFIPWPSLRMANIILAPAASAFISQELARRRRKDDPFIIPRNHFWQSFWFTLGITAVRFAYTVRS